MSDKHDADLFAASLSPELAADMEAVAADHDAWIQQGLDNGAALKATLTDEHAGWFVNPACRLWGAHEWKPEQIADQTADYNAFNGISEAAAVIDETPKDWRDIRGDLGI